MRKKNTYSFILALVLGVVLAVGGSVWATSIGTNLTVSGTLTVDGASTQTGATTLSSTLGVTGATTLSSTLAVTGLSTLTGGVLTNSATSTIRNLNMVTSTSTSATSTSLYASGQFQVGSSGTNITSIKHGFCAFGPILATQSIAATSTGTVACTGEVPAGLAAGDKIWLTASTTATGVVTGGGSIIYTGIASSTATDRIQAMVFNGTGAAWTVTTSTWQYFIIK